MDPNELTLKLMVAFVKILGGCARRTVARRLSALPDLMPKPETNVTGTVDSYIYCLQYSQRITGLVMCLRFFSRLCRIYDSDPRRAKLSSTTQACSAHQGLCLPITRWHCCAEGCEEPRRWRVAASPPSRSRPKVATWDPVPQNNSAENRSNQCCTTRLPIAKQFISTRKRAAAAVYRSDIVTERMVRNIRSEVDALYATRVLRRTTSPYP